MKMLKFIALLALLLSPSFSLFSQEAKEKIHWIKFEEAVELNKKEPKKFMVYIYSDNCGWCRKMERETFFDSAVIDYLRRHYHPVKLNKDIKRKIQYENRSFTYLPVDPESKTGGYHELVALLLEGRLAFPSIAYLNEDMIYLGVERGYKSVPSFLERLRLTGNEGF